MKPSSELTAVKLDSEYDRFAWLYNKHWGHFAEDLLPLLKEIGLDHVPSRARVLDLCCGTGQLAQILHENGYQVTGVDVSKKMLKFARENAPNCEFIVEDARSFKLPSSYHAVFSTYDSLNHIMSLDELKQVFRSVFSTLQAGWIFLFDLNMEKGYKARWQSSFGIVEEDYACVI